MEKHLGEAGLGAVNSLDVSDSIPIAVMTTLLPRWLRGQSRQPRWERCEQDSLGCQSRKG